MGESVFLGCVSSGWWEWETGGTWEKWGSIQESWGVFLDHIQEFCEDTPDTPDINSGSVVFLEKDKFWGSVPSGDNVSSKFSLDVFSVGFFGSLRKFGSLLNRSGARLRWSIILGRTLRISLFNLLMSTFNTLNRSSKTKITNFNWTIFIDQNIGWLKISMKNFSRMKILQSTNYIVGKSLNMDEIKMDWWFEQFFQVRLTKICNNIDMVKCLPILWGNNFNDRNEIFMFQESKKCNFSENSLTIYSIIK